MDTWLERPESYVTDLKHGHKGQPGLMVMMLEAHGVPKDNIQHFQSHNGSQHAGRPRSVDTSKAMTRASMRDIRDRENKTLQKQASNAHPSLFVGLGQLCHLALRQDLGLVGNVVRLILFRCKQITHETSRLNGARILAQNLPCSVP